MEKGINTRRCFLFLGALFFFFSCQDDQEVAALPDEIDFNFHIRPILSDNCFLCHGPDPSSREADLRLDLAETAKAKREGGIYAIRAGKAKSSEVYRRITSDDPDYVMPPPETNKHLSSREKALLKKWIDDGADWKPYWAFIPPGDQLAETEKHPVDVFVDAKLDELQLVKSPMASGRKLIRRLAYLLTGLPPEDSLLEQADQMHDPQHYEAMVDALLASPQFGERWSRHWMDLMRYAEGHGHEFDYPILGAHHYRDYLIRAFNADVPYDQLIKEHLAGDLLEDPRRHPNLGFNESVIGTGFYPMGEGKHSPVDTKEEEAVRIDNIIDVTTKTFQGLTLACAKCHDHKFDPLPTSDYYAMYGIFESTRFHNVSIEQTPSKEAKMDSIEELREEIRLFIDRKTKDGSIQGTPTSAEEQQSRSNFSLMADFRDGVDFDAWFSDGYAFGKQTTLHDYQIESEGKQHLRLYSKGVASSRKYGTSVMGALRSPTFIITERYLGIRAAGSGSSIRIVLDNHQLIQDPIHGELEKFVDSIAPHDIHFDLEMWKGSKVYIEIMPGQYYVKQGRRHHFKIEPDDWVEAYFAWTSDSLIQEIDQYIPSIPGREFELADVTDREQVTSRLRQITELQTSLADSNFLAGVTEGDALESPVFIRGSHRQLSEDRVPHRFFTVLGGDQDSYPSGGSNRLDLALSIADRNNPLTARVMVNRIWHHLFGRGIVETVDNFGLQGSIPSHPKLLDHLAIKFMDEGWSIKEIIRYIVTSAAFKRANSMREENQTVDPANIFLHHFPVRRLEGEAIRDAILKVSGELDLTLYGPSIPLYLTDFLRGRGRPPASGPLDGYGRRSIYMQLYRNFLPPMMLTFDMPMPFTTFGRRNVTNVPAQSLTLLNDPFIQDQANKWASKLDLSQPRNSLVHQLYIKAFSRPPTDAELNQAAEFFHDQQKLYVASGEGFTEEILWEDFCHGIFNMKEFIYLL